MAIGAGWQSSVALINTGCYYLFGLPVGAVLGFKLNLNALVRRDRFSEMPLVESTRLTRDRLAGHLVGNAGRLSAADGDPGGHYSQNQLAERGKHFPFYVERLFALPAIKMAPFFCRPRKLRTGSGRGAGRPSPLGPLSSCRTPLVPMIVPLSREPLKMHT